MFTIFLNLGYLFRLGCLVNKADRMLEYFGDTLQKVEMLRSPRCIKSHLPLQLLPKQLWTLKPKVYIVVFPNHMIKGKYLLKLQY